MSRIRQLYLDFFVLVLFCLASTLAFAGTVVPGFNSSTLPANDDGSTGAISIGFPVNFFGTTYTTLFVNNNGNITFSGPYSTFTPTGLASIGMPIVAPFFADVDTRANSSPVTYGPGTFAGRPAFGVNWVDVNCFAAFSTTPLGNNSFQLILVDRSDIGAGEFDMYFNYDQMLWEAGTASGGNIQCLGGPNPAYAGFSNGTTTTYQLPGSGTAGALLDGGANALIKGSLNTGLDSRYLFMVRGGIPNTNQNPIPALSETALALLTILLLLSCFYFFPAIREPNKTKP